MIENFLSKRDVFETLVAMIRQDRGLRRVDATWTDPDDPAIIGVAPERIAIYRKLFGDAGVPRGFHAYGASITFIAYTSGMVVHGSSKSYAYGRGQYDPDAIDDDLDVAAGKARKFFERRRIEGDWYLELMIN